MLVLNTLTIVHDSIVHNSFWSTYVRRASGVPSLLSKADENVTVGFTGVNSNPFSSATWPLALRTVVNNSLVNL